MMEIDKITDESFNGLRSLREFIDNIENTMVDKGLNFKSAKCYLKDINFYTEYRNGRYGAIDIHFVIIGKDNEQ